MVRKMLGLKRWPGELRDSFFSRTNRRVRMALSSAKIDKWDAQYFRAVFKLAGFLQRAGNNDPNRLSYQVMRYKDWAWLQKIMAAHKGSQLHCRKLRTWRWETQLRKLFENTGEPWTTVAADSRRWNSMLNDLVRRSCNA